MITTFDELINWVSTKRDEGIYFRGYQQKEELVATLGREKNRYYFNSCNNFEFLSYKMLALELCAKLTTPVTLPSVISIGQQFGLPTRYIDFTTDPCVALFFGLGNNCSPRFNIITINRDNHGIAEALETYCSILKDIDGLTFSDIDDLSLGSIGCLAANSTMSKSYIESPLFEKQCKKFLETQSNFAFVGSAVFKIDRIKAQSGLFIAIRDYTQPLEKYLYEDEAICLAEGEPQKLCEYLSANDYTYDELFHRCTDGVDVQQIVDDIKSKFCVKEEN